MHRLLMGVAAVATLVALLSGCSTPASPPSADEAARQTAITRQGAINAPAPGTTPGGGAPSSAGH